MTTFKLLAAAALLTSVAAGSALAQDNVRYRRANDGFVPGAFAAGVVGGALSTAGAIAGAPFRDDGYAYDSTYDDSFAYAPAPAYSSNWDNGSYGQSYAQRNGFVCTPGTWYRNDYGRTQLCQ